MSSGERAAEQTKGFVKGIGDVSESLRQNVNSFADDIIGSKSNTHSNTADGNHITGSHTTGTTGTTGTTTTGTTGGSGFSADAKAAGQEVRNAVNQAGTGHNTTTSSTGTKY